MPAVKDCRTELSTPENTYAWPNAIGALANNLKAIAVAGLLFFTHHASAQLFEGSSTFESAWLKVDTLTRHWNNDKVAFQNQWHLPLPFGRMDPVVEFYLPLMDQADVQHISLLPSAEWKRIDSLLITDNVLRFKLKFQDLCATDFLKLQFQISKATGETKRFSLPLQPIANTRAELNVKSENLFLGEEKPMEVLSNQAENIVLKEMWQQAEGFEYRMSREGNKVLLHLRPTQAGSHTFILPIELRKPILDKGQLKFKLPPKSYQFEVKSGRLAFLSLSVDEISLPENPGASVEVQMDDHPALRMEKTYRLEKREEPGGALMAEIFTKSRLINDKVLVELRPYGYHRKTDGYLYLKDGDRAQFITNVDISHKTKINEIFLQREGEEWKKGNAVYPGEIVNVRFQGQGLHRGEFNFYGAPLLVGDSLVRNEDVAYFKIKVPMDIAAREIEIFHENKSTGKSLQVKEYQRPAPFNFIDIKLGLKSYQLNEINHPIYFERTLNDLVIDFDERKLDRPHALHGKQFITIRVKISNKAGNLIELYEFDDLVICPGDNSPRLLYYNEKNCQVEDIALNNFLSRKTHDLSEWSRIELEFSHDREKYGGDGYTKRISIVLKRDLNFDIDVSFPAGLLILKDGENDFSNFSGISFAMIGQLSFYHPDKIAKYRPFKFGAGFIALDAFNFSDNATNRDVGLVALASVYPTSSENKLSFPLYVGYGYLLKQKKSFFLIGPGIRVRF